MSTYTKSALDTPDLLAILKQRWLVIANEPNALHTLSVISYFRLASFFRPQEADKHTHQFRQGCTLGRIQNFECAPVGFLYLPKKLSVWIKSLYLHN